METHEVLISPPIEVTSENGQSQPADQWEGDRASTGGLDRNPKAQPMKNSSTTIMLSEWVTSTTKTKVCFDQIVIDHDRSFGHVRKSSERVQWRYDDLKAAPPVDYIQDLLFDKVIRMSPVAYCHSQWVILFVGTKVGPNFGPHPCLQCFWCIAIFFLPMVCVDLSVGKYLLVIECGTLHTIFKCKCTSALCACLPA